MRVLFTTTPGWGHVNPMVPLARAFLDRGDEVLWATAADVCARLEREGFRAETAGLDEREGMARLRKDYPEIRDMAPLDRPPFMFPRLFGVVRAQAMLADLLPVAQRWGPDVVVRDAAEFAAPVVAGILEIPSVTHAFGALLPPDRVAAAGAAVEPLWAAHGLEPRPYGGSYDHLYVDIYPPSLSSSDRSHVPAVQLLRPVTFAVCGDEPVPELARADTPDPLVYVTFGTVFNEDTPLIGTVVEALRDLPVRVVVTLGPQASPDLLGPQPPNVHVGRYISHQRILPRCSAVVSHAGSGTFLAALAEGLPQVLLPQAADQFLNAEAGTRSGSAVALYPGTATSERVRAAAEQALGDASLRSAAERIGDEIRAMPSPDDVADAIDAVVV